MTVPANYGTEYSVHLSKTLKTKIQHTVFIIKYSTCHTYDTLSMNISLCFKTFTNFSVMFIMTVNKTY